MKWKRWAYIHCSWENRLTLSQLKGVCCVSTEIYADNIIFIWVAHICVMLECAHLLLCSSDCRSCFFAFTLVSDVLQ